MANSGFEWQLTEMIVGAGALGGVAFGIVDGLKWSRKYATKGFDQIPATLGPALMQSLSVAYGPEYRALVEAQYIDGRSKGDLSRTLRQGVRIGLTVGNAVAMAETVGVIEPERLASVVRNLRDGKELTPEEKGILARFELAGDARIDAGLGLAEQAYRSWARVAAIVVAVVLGLVAAAGIAYENRVLFSAELLRYLFWGFIIGIAAVPIAPVAKDIAKGIQSAAKAIRVRV